MNLWRDPRVLRDDWTPPTLEGREELLRELTQALPTPRHPHPRVSVLLWGPRGSGTSTVARWFSRSLWDQWSASSRFPPLELRVDASRARTPSQLITHLFRVLDPEVHARGASTEHLVLLLLRRIRSLHRPTIVWLDQVRPGAAHVARVLAPLVDPDRLLPEGTTDLPCLAVIASGTFDPLAGEVEGPERRPFGPVLSRRVPTLAPELLLRALETRARLAFDAPPAREVLVALRDLLLAHGWGLSLAGPMLSEAARRAQARGARTLGLVDLATPEDPRLTPRESHVFDTLLLEAMRSAGPVAYERGLPLSEIRAQVTARCDREGQPHPSPARLWRHTVALERAGVLRRDVHIGGTGGTSSVLRLTPTGTGSLPSTLPPALPGREEPPLGPQGPGGPGLDGAAGGRSPPLDPFEPSVPRT